MMGERGQVKTGITVMIMLIAFFTLYALFNKPLDIIWSTTENAAPSNAPSSIWTSLNYVWPAIFVIVFILILVWLFARAGRTEHEYSTFFRLERYNIMEVSIGW